MRPELDEDKKIEFSVEKCFKTFDQSFNRIKYFICIAENLTEKQLPSFWSIQNPGGISYGVNEPDSKNKPLIVEGYKHFIKCYVLRDCIESFSLSLDKLFLILLIHGKKYTLIKLCMMFFLKRTESCLRNLKKILVSMAKHKF